MKLLIQPGDGPAALLAAIRGAQKHIEIAIFRFDRAEIEAALKAAVGRGVAVSALIAYTNRGGEINLRKLEMRLLEFGVTVSRTADDLLRYHDKLMIIDRKTLFVLSFNYTHLDIDHSRGFGIVTRNPRMVQEASRLFEADSNRTPYAGTLGSLVVSPSNARKVLGGFIAKAQRQLLIYDPTLNDPGMFRILEARRKAGVEIRVIGHAGKENPGLEVRALGPMRLHTRTIIRDGTQAFIGSQSLSLAELDSRREVGVLVRDAKVLAGLTRTFEADWRASAVARGKGAATPKALKKVTKDLRRGLVKELTALNPIVKEALREVAAEKGKPVLNPEELKNTVKGAVKEAVKERVAQVVKASLLP